MSFQFRARCLAIAIATVCHGSAVLAADAVAPSPSAAASQAAPPAATAAPVNPQVPPASRPETAQLNGVTVKGKRDLLGESEVRMQKLKDSLPDLSSDAGRKEGLAQRIVDAADRYLVSHKDPNKLNDDSKSFIEHVQSPLDSTHDAGKPVIPQPDAKDYVDPLCQTGSCPP